MTRDDIARAAGVSTGTVSQALSGKGSVKASTRERVLRIAAEMGYRPNAVASLLAQKRHRGSKNPQITIAYLGGNESNQSLFMDAATRENISGAIPDLGAYDNPQSLLRVLWHRGVQGILLNPGLRPWRESELAACDWSRFSVLKLGRVYPSLSFHVVRHSAFEYAWVAFGEVVRRGYKNIAALLQESGSQSDDDARLGAVMALSMRHSASGVRMEYRWANPRKEPRIAERHLSWLQKRKPDAILSFLWSPLPSLVAAGWRFPRDAGFATIMRPQIPGLEQSMGLPVVAGCDPSKMTIFERGIAELKRLVARGEQGMTELPHEHVVEPRWVEGETLPDIILPAAGNSENPVSRKDAKTRR